jgi:hypothetical protein
MAVNANPRVRVTGVIGDTSKKRAWKGVFEAAKVSDEAKNKAKASQSEAFERRIENELGFQLAV